MWRIAFFFSVLSFLSINLIAQTRFTSEKNIIGLTVGDPASLFGSDLDGDGDTDIVAGASQLVWYKNLDGQGTFSASNVISSTAAKSVVVADLDRDGDFDVISASGNQILWHENRGIHEEMRSPHIITEEVQSSECVYASDLDGDGDQDILSASLGDNKIAWYENDGTGTFGPQQIISTGALWAKSVFAADLDGDGDQDVMSASELDNKVAWYENIDGQGTFGTPQILTNAVDSPQAIRSVDLDKDGDFDILSASFGDNKIAWYENMDGTGNFGTQRVITASAHAAFFVNTADLDGDGDLDVLSASGDRMAWYEHIDGMGTFSEQKIITNSAFGARSILASDIDGDGDQDLVTSSVNDDKIAWYQNSDGQGEFVLQTLVNPILAGDPFTVFASDLDGDGDLDALSGSQGNDNTIAWYENTDGHGSFGPKEIIGSSVDGAAFIRSADLDNDDDLDVLLSSRNVAWYENLDAQGTFGEARIILSSTHQIAAEAADFDNDGDLDLLTSADLDQLSGIGWFENTDALGNFGPRQEISSSSDGVAIAADINGDGNTDVVSGVAWFENIGNGEFERRTPIGSQVSLIFAMDIDGDQDLDIISAQVGSDAIQWHENTDGKGRFDVEHTLDTTLDFLASMFVTDLDEDGDADLVVSSFNDHKVAWYENIQAGNFGQEQIISELDQVTSVYAADLNGDAFRDVLAVSISSTGKISWFRNIAGNPTSVRPVERNSIPSAFILHQNYPNPFNPLTKITYELGVNAHVRIQIFNILGQEIKTLLNTDKQTGSYSLIWDGKDYAGRMVPSGVYIYRLETNNSTVSKKMLLLQ